MTNLAYPMLYITRKEKGDTQKKVASKLGISPQRYQLKESGKAILILKSVKFFQRCMKCQSMNYSVHQSK